MIFSEIRNYGDPGFSLSIVNRGEGLEAGGVAKLCYCSLSRDNTYEIVPLSVVKVM